MTLGEGGVVADDRRDPSLQSSSDHVHSQVRHQLLEAATPPPLFLDKRFGVQCVSVSDPSFKCLDLNMARTIPHNAPSLSPNER